MLDVMWHIEGNNTSLILKDDFDTNTNFLNFMCKTAAVMVRYSTFFINTTSPEFVYQDFIREFTNKIEENLFRKKSDLLLVIEIEDYWLDHSLNTNSRRKSISQLLLFL